MVEKDKGGKMQVVLLCGGTGTRLKEMTEYLPKPLIPIGGKPMITHIMKTYSHYGFSEFVLALGYKQEAFKQYFEHYDIINSDITIDIGILFGGRKNHSDHSDIDDWTVTMSDTGEHTLKGGRLNRIKKYIKGDTFFLSYGDSIGDINIRELLDFHNKHGKMVTVTGVQHPPRFGEIQRDNNKVVSFSEKQSESECLINAGYFVMNTKIFDYLYDDCDLEKGVLEQIATEGEMMVYHHKGYWGCMDTLSDMIKLQELWDSGKVPWAKESNNVQ